MRTVRAAVAVLLLALSGQAAAQGGVHAHGEATMSVVIDGSSLVIGFEAPGADIVGFERAPATDEERRAVEAARAALADPLALIDLPAEASCLPEGATVEVEGEGEHSAFQAEWRFTCADPTVIDEFGLRLFERFPSLKAIDIEAAGPAGQGAAEIERGGAARVSLAGVAR